jgi:hypothetical protein
MTSVGVLIIFSLFSFSVWAKNWVSSPSDLPTWVSDLPVPINQPLYLVIKGTFSTWEGAVKRREFIQQLLPKTISDGIDKSDYYQGLPKGKFIVGMLFDSQERARWWMNFSYRNRTIPKGTLKTVTVTGTSHLPYMPSLKSYHKVKLIDEEGALQSVKGLPDIQRLSEQKKLIYKFTDYPRNGDLRYEVEVLEDRGQRPPIMVDFIMVCATSGQVVERLSEALAPTSKKQR